MRMESEEVAGRSEELCDWDGEPADVVGREDEQP